MPFLGALPHSLTANLQHLDPIFPPPKKNKNHPMNQTLTTPPESDRPAALQELARG